MPPKNGFKWITPIITRKLRPLTNRVKNVGKTIEFIKDLINFELEEYKKVLLVAIRIVLVVKVYLIALEFLKE